jgi:hypothetical protein
VSDVAVKGEAPRKPGEPCHHDKNGWDWHDFECRAEVWQGPEGLTAANLRYSVVISIAREWRVGHFWPRPVEIDGVTWKFNRRERESDGWTSFVYDAAMDFSAFLYMMRGYEDGSESGGIMGPTEAPDWWAPSVVYDCDNERLFVTAWPKVRYEFAGPDAHLFDEWDAICRLLTGKATWGSDEEGEVDGNVHRPSGNSV